MNKLTSEIAKRHIQVEFDNNGYKAMVFIAANRVRYATAETREDAVGGLIQKIS